MELKDYKAKVSKILEHHPTARNSDSILLAHYINTYRSHLVKRDPEGTAYIELKNFREFPAIETLTRARRVIQNHDHEFLPTSLAVRKARRIKEENYRNAEVREAYKS